jgi:anaphase-promoting complex subunit 2
MDSFFLPNETLRASQAKFESHYNASKVDRKLNWTNSIGYASLEIEFDNITLPFECSNDEASVLILLSENENLTFIELLEMAGFDESRLKMSLKTWLEKEIVLCNDRDQLYVVNSYKAHDANECFIDYELKSWNSDKTHSNVTVPKFKDIFEKVFPLIQGMLRNMGALPVSKIHSSLGLFSSEYKEHENDLKRFLDYKASSGVIQIKPDGIFSLKSDS